MLLVPAETQVGPAYRVGFKNFEVITRYNRSVRYAMAVHDLATDHRGTRRGRRCRADEKTANARRAEAEDSARATESR